MGLFTYTHRRYLLQVIERLPKICQLVKGVHSLRKLLFLYQTTATFDHGVFLKNTGLIEQSGIGNAPPVYDDWAVYNRPVLRYIFSLGTKQSRLIDITNTIKFNRLNTRMKTWLWTVLQQCKAAISCIMQILWILRLLIRNCDTFPVKDPSSLRSV